MLIPRVKSKGMSDFLSNDDIVTNSPTLDKSLWSSLFILLLLGLVQFSPLSFVAPCVFGLGFWAASGECCYSLSCCDATAGYVHLKKKGWER